MIDRLGQNESVFGRFRDFGERVDDILFGDEQSRRRTFRIGGIVLGCIVLPLLVWGVWSIIPRRTPNYDTGRIDKLMNFTLLTNEFNNLPIQKRLELLGTLRERFEKMSATESVLLASFAGGIMGKARAQIEENVSMLMIDMWDQYANGYDNVPLEDRARYLDTSLVDMVRAMETLAGEESGMSDNQIVTEMHEQAQRDAKAIREGKGPPPRAIGRLAEFFNNNVRVHSSPSQQIRGQQMMLDMVRHMRGQDIATGKPLKPGGG
ncbi:MAG: hypothetical protein H6815_03980 [Phycisphaeraceae bacterium]|nr:hypothetical protein [Phycisphaeraceae bacterium]